MKKFLYLVLSFPALLFSQSNIEKQDYFIQFNTPQFAKKVSLEELVDHKAFTTFNKDSAAFKLKEFIAFVDQTRPVVIHGNFTDSIAFYQMTLPVKDATALTTFIQNKVDFNNSTASDSVVEAIHTYSKYTIYSPKDSDYTLAWNTNNLIVYGLIENNLGLTNSNYADYNETDSVAVAVDEEYYEEEYEEDEVAPFEEVVVEEYKEIEAVEVVEAITEEDWEEEQEEETYEDDSYYNTWLEENKKQQAQARRDKQIRQEEEIAFLFEDEFIFPTSNKLNPKADISTWVDYQSVYGKMNSFNYLFSSFFGVNNKTEVADNLIKGMNFDISFTDDQAIMEQTIEYSESLATIMSKVVARKPNKNIFKYFPKKDPLAYMTYHSSTKEILKSYPEITEQMLVSLPFEKQDTGIITDLISTILDEEAIATLFDGDLSVFLHSIKPYEYTYTTTSYDEDYEEVTEEKTLTKTRPIFSMVMTSTHPTMINKLLNLGVRKKVLEKVANYYVMSESNEMGPITFLKDGDVFVITNGVDYLNNGSNSSFAKQVKKELCQNYMFGNFNVQSFVKSMLMSQDFGKETEKMLKVSNQFKNVEFKSSKKLKDNKMKLEMTVNSNFSNKNIVIQTLDLIDYLN